MQKEPPWHNSFHHFHLSYSFYTLKLTKAEKWGQRMKKVLIINKAEGKTMSKSPQAFQNHWCKDIIKTQEQSPLAGSGCLWTIVPRIQIRKRITKLQRESNSNWKFLDPGPRTPYLYLRPCCLQIDQMLFLLPLKWLQNPHF